MTRFSCHLTLLGEGVIPVLTRFLPAPAPSTSARSSCWRMNAARSRSCPSLASCGLRDTVGTACTQARWEVVAALCA